ncbi:FBP domain-containing protein [Homoserinibacter sp. YIM 151385]|uniref:FBP domain-containing protein n=1 Tax=Homoserinibacter sp. YIM 151385 TaxID=2985506 RepID=UPI0022F0A358|nr:FBP domain-containing protein [Homoserinibacter sp. YIM 151385]WBU39084.1 FBP domain-containing protein [Homoserinibacter sp. YIM 151385]
MKPLTEADIRASLVNAPPGEAQRMPLPGLHEVLWEEREYLGWRDPQAPQRGYLVFWRDGEPVGLVVRAAAATMGGGAALCNLCNTQQPADQVRMFSAPKTGEAGERGNSVGTYICRDLACSLIIRIAPAASTSFRADQDAAVAARAEGLSRRLESFADRVLDAA